MAQRPLTSLFNRSSWICKRCSKQAAQRANFTTSLQKRDELEIRAAPEIDFENVSATDAPARIIPASPSYFTGAPVFNDNMLLLQSLNQRYQHAPLIPADKAPPTAWLRLGQYQSVSGERVTTTQYAQLLRLAVRLSRIHPQLRPEEVDETLSKFQRSDVVIGQRAKLGTIDVYGRAKGVGRRKESAAKVYLVEGDGEVLINNRSIVDIFPRLHDRESVLWPLKVSERMHKYNVFALVSGGGVTGQAEAITLGLARALIVHEPALKPILRRGKIFLDNLCDVTNCLLSWMRNEGY